MWMAITWNQFGNFKWTASSDNEYLYKSEYFIDYRLWSIDYGP